MYTKRAPATAIAHRSQKDLAPRGFGSSLSIVASIRQIPSDEPRRRQPARCSEPQRQLHSLTIAAIYGTVSRPLLCAGCRFLGNGKPADFSLLYLLTIESLWLIREPF